MKRSGLWYKVRHPWFDPKMAYQAIDYVLHSETAWGYIVFCVPAGHTFAVQVRRCTLLGPDEGEEHPSHVLWLGLTAEEIAKPWATKPEILNPDLDVDMQ